MRKLLIGVLVVVFGPVAVLLLERLMGSATSTGWQLAGTAVALTGWVILVLSDPVYDWLSRSSRTLALSFVSLGSVFVIGLAWLVLGWALPELATEAGPDPAVSINAVAGSYYLAVRNRGARAVFYAEIEVLEYPDMFVPLTFPGFWERARGPRTDIVSGLQDRICIGAVTGAGGNIVSLYYFNPVRASQDSIQRYIGEAPSDRFRFTVRISSDPAPKNGPYVETYHLTRNGLWKEPWDEP